MDTTEEVEEVVESAPAPVTMDPTTALKEVLKTALKHGGLARGLRESVKALDRREAHLCVLATNVDEPAYLDLVRALCSAHKIQLKEVSDSKQLGEWAGLCKLDRDANPCKIVSCACVVVKNYGEQSDALNYLINHLKGGQ